MLAFIATPLCLLGKQVHKFGRVGQLGVDLIIFSRNEETCQRVDHKSVNFIHSVLEIQGLIRLMHESVVQNYRLEYSPSV